MIFTFLCNFIFYELYKYFFNCLTTAFFENNFRNMTYVSTRKDTTAESENFIKDTIQVYTKDQVKIIYTESYLNGELSSERYYECTNDGTFYLYTFSNGVWTKTKQNGNPAQDICEEIRLFQKLYSQMKYDSQNKIFKGENITDEDLAINNAAVSISFKDGKITNFSVDMKDEKTTTEIRTSIDYTITEITLPAVTE